MIQILDITKWYNTKYVRALQWCHNECNGISNYQHLDCLLNCLFRRRPKKTSKLLVTGLCEGNSIVTGEFPAQRASNEENISIWWHRQGVFFLWHNQCLQGTHNRFPTVLHRQPSHYLIQCWHNISWTPSNKLWWNMNQNIMIFFQEYAHENVVCKMSAISHMSQCVSIQPDWRLSLAVKAVLNNSQN